MEPAPATPELSAQTQAAIEEALRRQREELTAGPPVQVRHTQASAAAVGRGTQFEAEMEALKRPITLTFRDLTLTLPAADVWLVDFTDTMQSGNPKAALLAVLGADQYAAFRALQPAPGMIDHLALAQEISQAVKAGDS